MDMVNEIVDLFHNNFPDIIRSEYTIREILGDITNHFICFKDKDKVVGVSVIQENVIIFFCVDESYQNQGIGTLLLKQSEAYIKSAGFHKIVVGAGKNYIMPGIPMSNNAHLFFQKRAYYHSWKDCGCFDMSLLLKDFIWNENSIGDTIKGITYRWATINDIEEIKKCVSDAEEEFLQFYESKSLYKNDINSAVLIAEKDQEVLGTLIVSREVEGPGIGSVGCTTTMKEHRNKGIATTMVRLGTKYLKDSGMTRAFLGYTYSDILSIYNRSGYAVSMEYYMGEKLLI